MLIPKRSTGLRVPSTLGNARYTEAHAAPEEEHYAAVLAAIKNEPAAAAKKRPFLTAAPRVSSMRAEAGTEEWPRPNKGMPV